MAANDRCALVLKLSPGQAGDAPHGRELLEAGGPVPAGCPLIMDRAYEGDETLRLARQLGYLPVVPPNPNRLAPWEYDRTLYHRRNEIERLFRRLKAYRRVFCRFDKLDVLFAGFIVLALIVEALRMS
ncbi:MAG: transposase [Pedosphaera sp.]|nr:transposase [Pedosphaera sp.]